MSPASRVCSGPLEARHDDHSARLHSCRPALPTTCRRRQRPVGVAESQLSPCAVTMLPTHARRPADDHGSNRPSDLGAPLPRHGGDADEPPQGTPGIGIASDDNPRGHRHPRWCSTPAGRATLSINSPMVGEGGPTRRVRRMMAEAPCRRVGRRVLWAVTGCGGQAVWRLRLSRVRVTHGVAQQVPDRHRQHSAGPTELRLQRHNQDPGRGAEPGGADQHDEGHLLPRSRLGCSPGVVTGYSTPVEGSTVSRADPRGPGGRSSVPV